MNFLKKPAIAVLLTIILVFSSTVVSVKVKLGEKCQDVIDGCHDGVVVDGVQRESIASQLRNINNAADGIIKLAVKYGVNVEDAEYRLEDLKLALTYSEEFASYIHYCYEDLMSETHTLNYQLSEISLSEQDADMLSDYNEIIDQAQNNIKNSGYNESVREFLRDEMKYPADVFASIAGVYPPEYFE